jgi:hypothetical protein
MITAVQLPRTDSIYKDLPDTKVWDIDRDAQEWPGGSPLVAHPPCRFAPSQILNLVSESWPCGQSTGYDSSALYWSI